MIHLILNSYLPNFKLFFSSLKKANKDRRASELFVEYVIDDYKIQ